MAVIVDLCGFASFSCHIFIFNPFFSIRVRITFHVYCSYSGQCLEFRVFVFILMICVADAAALRNVLYYRRLN